MHFYPNERLALFVDGANLYATAKALGFDIDYKRLLALFRGKGHLVRALYYTALAEDQEYSSIRPLVDWLDYNGYTMVTKPTKEFTDALGRIAHESILVALALRKAPYPFAHGARHAVRANLALFDSFHCSRYNTNTGKLTPQMFDAVLAAIGLYLKQRI